MNHTRFLGGLMLMGLAGAVGAHADAIGASPTRAMPEYELVIRNHQFSPSTLKVPANTKFKVLVTNQDSTPSEFESNDFSREKLVPAGSTVTVFIGPLSEGHYEFFDDFHRSTCSGVLIVQ
jgi:hypothetical protein